MFRRSLYLVRCWRSLCYRSVRAHVPSTSTHSVYDDKECQTGKIWIMSVPMLFSKVGLFRCVWERERREKYHRSCAICIFAQFSDIIIVSNWTFWQLQVCNCTNRQTFLISTFAFGYKQISRHRSLEMKFRFANVLWRKFLAQLERTENFPKMFRLRTSFFAFD